jgi:hypothetical protein
MKSVVALVIGLAVMILGRELLLVALPTAVAAAPGDLAAQLASGPITSLVVLSSLLVITGVTTLFGAWLTARLAPDHPAGHAVFAAVVWLAVLVFRGALEWNRVPLWVHATTWVMVPLAAFAGARAWERATRRRDRGAVSFDTRNASATR